MDPWSYSEKSKSEHGAQVSLFMWSNMANYYGLHVADCVEAYTVQGWAIKNCRGDLEPRLKWLHAIHNQGHGDKVRGSLAKAEGVKAGVLDLFLPVPMRYATKGINGTQCIQFCGLYVEMKVGSNKPSEKQIEFINDATLCGYKCEVAYSWIEARDKILSYLSL